MGKVLAGRYELLKQVAAGGMATVHLARALGVGGFERLVAVKVMHPHIGAETEFVTMFLDEARLAARIRHPNVVPTLDVQESPDGLFLVMEYIEGPSLHQLMKAAGKAPGSLPLGIVLRLMLDTLAGLHAAHELADDEGAILSLVHRDVTPVNILIGTDGVARITDFGVARAEARLSSTRGGQLKGKIPYMPPEQVMGEPVDRRCDIYAAGAVMWEALAGRRLFRADSDGALLRKILAGPEATPRQVDPTLPESIDRVCMRALARNPNERFETAAALSEALEAAAQEASVTIASARALASFIEASGAFVKMSAKELTALKRGAGDVPSPAPSVPSGMSAPGSGAAAPPQLLDTPPSSPSLPSQPTTLGSALSAPGEAPRPRRVGIYAAAVAAAVALGVVGSFFFLGDGAKPGGEPAKPGADLAEPRGGDTAKPGTEGSSARPTPPGRDASPAAVPPAAVPPAAVPPAEGASAPAIPSAAPSASSAPPGSPLSGVKSAGSRPPAPPPPNPRGTGKTKPGPTAYDPDRL